MILIFSKLGAEKLSPILNDIENFHRFCYTRRCSSKPIEDMETLFQSMINHLKIMLIRKLS